MIKLRCSIFSTTQVNLNKAIEHEEVPDYASADGSETDLLSAFSPLEALSSKMTLLPPQHVEFSRLAKIKSLDDLKDYASNRSSLGMRRACPNTKPCSDGIIMILPGDKEHQTDYDFENSPNISHLSCKENVDFSEPTAKVLWQQGTGCQVYTNNQWLFEDCQMTSPLSATELNKMIT